MAEKVIKYKKVGRPKGRASRATICEFKELLEEFVEGRMTWNCVWSYMKRKGWLTDKAPTQLITIKKPKNRGEG